MCTMRSLGLGSLSRPDSAAVSLLAETHMHTRIPVQDKMLLPSAALTRPECNRKCKRSRPHQKPIQYANRQGTGGFKKFEIGGINQC